MAHKKQVSGRQLATERESFVAYMEEQLIGPAKGATELIKFPDKPYERYLMGALFPIGAGAKVDDDGEDQGTTGAGDEADDPISLAYQIRPASCGLSFFTRAEQIAVEIRGARYNPVAEGWKRYEFGSRSSPISLSLTRSSTSVENIGDMPARLTSVWRSHGKGWLVTIVLSHKTQTADGRFTADQVLYQVGMICSPKGCPVEAYPSPNRYSWDVEEEDLALIYREQRTFAIGHGVAATWARTSRSSVDRVETAFLPRHEVPAITAELPPDDPMARSAVFSLQYLGDAGVDADSKIRLLAGLQDSYGCWVKGQALQSVSLSEFGGAPSRVIDRMDQAILRIGKGLRLLESDPDAMRCFELANRAMHMQMVHSSEEYAKNAKPKGRTYVPPTYGSSEWDRFRWRPFQLAFQLLVIESLANRNSTERDLVDLIWFPTGGGKTEAYLAVAAFELFYRRIKFGDAGGGTSVIKRYTLRLLTAQQFERVSALICACEMIRREHPDELGDEVFSLGLWVGSPSSPNDYQSAHEMFLELVQQRKPENPFQLQKCPWCGTRIIPTERHPEISEWYGVRCDQSRFELFCPEESCSFHDLLPINVVDDHLYAFPPSFLVGTIDKFARLAWTDKPHAFFAGSANGKRLPPSLIIQDELHLISGPLGTIAGLYEAAMDVVMQSRGAKPKFVAATATIRRASEQGRRLYARNVAIFPPSGLASDDSYFAREMKGEEAPPGRLYLGVMGQYHSPVTALVQTSAMLAQAPAELPLSRPARDGYWTQVIFHNSKRELGKTMTLCRDDIPKRVSVIASTTEKSRKTFDPVEMSANIPSPEIPAVLARLKEPCDAPGAVDMLPCTNMFSVGVDVGRLGLIVMNGQPKTTAEYIQASSRVGRSEVPGIVVAFYPSNKARDRSHYESFISYHQSLYRAVEPSSVTPYALPSMERALHAALVIAMRYSGGLLRDADASKFDPSKAHQLATIEALRARMKEAQSDDPVLCVGIDTYLEACVDTWAKAANSSRQGSRQLKFDARGSANFESLLVQYRPGINWKPEIPWATLNSMRNVDQECPVFVRGESS